MHDESMEITEEQRKRAEANRLAALEKRKAALESAKQSDPWKLFKCRKVSRESTSAATAIHPPKPQNASNDAFLKPHLTEKFRVRLEICSPDSFSITPKAVHGFAYPGEAECLQRLNDCLANVRFLILWSGAQKNKMKFWVLWFYFMFLIPIKMENSNLEKPNSRISLLEKPDACVWDLLGL